MVFCLVVNVTRYRSHCPFSFSDISHSQEFHYFIALKWTEVNTSASGSPFCFSEAALSSMTYRVTNFSFRRLREFPRFLLEIPQKLNPCCAFVSMSHRSYVNWFFSNKEKMGRIVKSLKRIALFIYLIGVCKAIKSCFWNEMLSLFLCVFKKHTLCCGNLDWFFFRFHTPSIIFL